MYSTIIKEEKEYFNSVLEKLKSEHKQIVADKQEIDLQLGAGIRTGRRKEDFEKKEEMKSLSGGAAAGGAAGAAGGGAAGAAAK